MATDFDLSCPVPLAAHERIVLPHGGGGRLTRELLDKVFVPAFANPALDARHDSALLEAGGARLAFTTDAYVVHPRRFPGGDIGTLAVCGTVNDLAMAGARPLALSAAFVLEEGLAMDELRAVVASMRDAARACGVPLVAGDTKVVDRGKADGMFVTTSGVGIVPPGADVRPARVAPGDVALLSGDVGRHGIAVLSVRDGLAFDSPVESDCAPLAEPVAALLAGGVEVHCLRDATRGGVATVLNEMARDAGVAIEAEEATIPVSGGVAAACEILGLDPLYVACEGRMVAFVAAADAARALDILRGHEVSRGAAIIGAVAEPGAGGACGTVALRTRLGTRRLLDLLSGEQLPRIC
ncbi:MAG: hydrogenase expression/formation protein HypE [Deltaproteobacteria bacterium]|nr:hydrogenase expression/formation protein HypE [Deltaproteobacteria bacterium]